MTRRRIRIPDHLEGPARHITIAAVLTPAQWAALRALAHAGSFPWIAKRSKATGRVLLRLDLARMIDGRPVMTETGRAVLGYGPGPDPWRAASALDRTPDP